MTSFEVLNCSSESDEFPALNLQTGQGAWQTDGYVREATVDIGFDKAISFDKVELGNLGCAFIELLVAKDTDSDEYEALVAPVALQSYSESKSNTNRTKSFVFTMKDKLKAKVAQQSWHKLRIICKQTFNTALPIGLNFVRINSTSKTLPQNTTTAASTTSAANTKGPASTASVKSNNNNALQKSGSRVVVEDRSDEEHEESAAALFAKIKPPTTFAQLKAQVEQEKSKTPVKKPPVTAPVTNNSAVVARDNPFSDTKKSAPIISNKGDGTKSAPINSKNDSAKTKSNNSTASQSATKNTAATQNTKSALPNKDKAKDSKDDKKKSVPLNKVMADVTIVISGIQNPERHKLRTLVKEMGGSYRPDWDDQATHLIAVFPNAPKVLQAAEDGATIVTKDWIYDSHKRAARQSVQPYLLGKKKPAPKDSDEEDDEGPNEYDYDDGFLVADDAMDDDYDPSLKAKPKKKPKNKAVMLADDDLDTINEAEQWLTSTKSQPKQGVKRKQHDEEDEEEELLHLNKKVKLDKTAAKSAANQLARDESDSGEGTEGMAEDDIAAQVQQMKSGKTSADKSSNTNKSAAVKSTSHKPNTVQQDDEDELTDEMREDEIRTHLKRASSQLSQSRDSQGTQELAEDELLY